MSSRVIIWSLVVILVLAGLYVKTLGFGGDGEVRKAVEAYRGFVLVELFTSQGCHSNPPADALLASLAPGAELGHPSIVTLGYHVDYWDFGGWKDPYSSGKWTIRQTDYTRRFGIDVPFTPDVVINGREQLTGSWGPWVRQGIAAELRRTHGANALGRCTYASDDGDGIVTVFYELVQADRARQARAFAALTLSSARTQVTAGENAGLNMHNTDIVLAMASAEAAPFGHLELSRPSLSTTAEQRVAAFVAEAESMEVLGARWCDEVVSTD